MLLAQQGFGADLRGALGNAVVERRVLVDAPLVPGRRVRQHAAHENELVDVECSEPIDQAFAAVDRKCLVTRIGAPAGY